MIQNDTYQKYQTICEKSLKKVPAKIREAATKRTKLFQQNRNHFLLRDHILIGQMDGLRAFSVTGDYRIIYQELNSEEIIFLFLNIGRQ